MTKPEITGLRKFEMEYSREHREKLPHYCYATDIDFIEFRKIENEFKPIALIELKDYGRHGLREYYQSAQFKVEKYIARKLEIPFFVVYPRDNEYIGVVDVFRKDVFMVERKEYWNGIGAMYIDDEGNVRYDFRKKERWVGNINMNDL